MGGAQPGASRPRPMLKAPRRAERAQPGASRSRSGPFGQSGRKQGHTEASGGPNVGGRGRQIPGGRACENDLGSHDVLGAWSWRSTHRCIRGRRARGLSGGGGAGGPGGGGSGLGGRNLRLRRGRKGGEVMEVRGRRRRWPAGHSCGGGAPASGNGGAWMGEGREENPRLLIPC